MNANDRRRFEMLVRVNQFKIVEASFGETASATAEHVAATADTIRQGMIATRTLDGIVRNRYTNDPGKLAAWIRASHVEKAPKKQIPPTP